MVQQFVEGETDFQFGFALHAERITAVIGDLVDLDGIHDGRLSAGGIVATVVQHDVDEVFGAVVADRRHGAHFHQQRPVSVQDNHLSPRFRYGDSHRNGRCAAHRAYRVERRAGSRFVEIQFPRYFPGGRDYDFIVPQRRGDRPDGLLAGDAAVCRFIFADWIFFDRAFGQDQRRRSAAGGYQFIDPLQGRRQVARIGGDLDALDTHHVEQAAGYRTHYAVLRRVGFAGAPAPTYDHQAGDAEYQMQRGQGVYRVGETGILHHHHRLVIGQRHSGGDSHR